MYICIHTLTSRISICDAFAMESTCTCSSIDLARESGLMAKPSHKERLAPHTEMGILLSCDADVFGKKLRLKEPCMS